MSFTYDVSTSRGKVRLLIPDKVEANALFTDDDIDAFLDMEGTVRLAAASAIEVVASDQAMVLKVLKTLDLETDGSKVSQALLARAKALREAEYNDSAVAIAEQVHDHWTERERLIKQAMRGII